jgi:hypothetical protein
MRAIALPGPTVPDRGIGHSIRAARPAIEMSAPGGGIRLLDRLRQAIYRTEQAYVDWTRRFIHFHGKRHPQELGAKGVGDFLSHLAVDRHVASSIQTQARSALLFLYGQVLDVQLPCLDDVAIAQTPSRWCENERSGTASPSS